MLSTGNNHSEMMKDLPELHRQLAALTNAHVHHDLRHPAQVVVDGDGGHHGAD